MQKNIFKRNLEINLRKVRRKKHFSKLLIICIGTDRMTGDCFGPLVGTNLNKEIKNARIEVIGNIKSTIGFQNVENYKEKLLQKDICVIAVDAALSSKENIGKICVCDKPIILGSGLINKPKKCIGDISIRAIVAQNRKHAKRNFEELSATPLSLVMELSDVVAEGIREIIV